MIFFKEGIQQSMSKMNYPSHHRKIVHAVHKGNKIAYPI